jgi:hypothetical protein
VTEDVEAPATLTSELLRPGTELVGRVLGLLDQVKFGVLVASAVLFLVLAGARLERWLLEQEIEDGG